MLKPAHREMEFSGKSNRTKDWVFGGVVFESRKTYIVIPGKPITESRFEEIIPATLRVVGSMEDNDKSGKFTWVLYDQPGCELTNGWEAF